MIAVSQAYKEAFQKHIRSGIKAEAIFEQMPVGARENGSVAATQIHALSKVGETNDEVMINPRYATGGLNHWVLDGTFDLYSANTANNGQTGYLSQTQSGESLLFASPPRLTRNYTQPFSAVGATVVFDPGSGGYATDFDIVAYQGGIEAQRIEVRGNTESIYVSAESLDSFTALAVEVLSGSHPYRHAHIIEFMPGIIWTFGNRDFVSPGFLEVLRSVDPLSDALAEGRCYFSIDNRAKKYNPLSPQGFWRYIEDRQRIFVQCGIEGEMVPLGTYYLSSNKTDRGQAKFSAFDTISFLDAPYPDQYINNQTYAFILTAALTTAGVPNFTLSPLLANYRGTANITNATCRQIVRHIAAAANMSVWVDRYDVLHVEPMDNTHSLYQLLYGFAPPPSDSVEEPVGSVVCAYFTWTSQTYDGVTTYRSVRTPVAVATGQNGKVVTVPDIPFVNTAAYAQRIAQFRASYIADRLRLQNQWPQYPPLEIGDIIDIQTEFGVARSSQVLEQHFICNGGLTGYTKLKGGRE